MRPRCQRSTTVSPLPPPALLPPGQATYTTLRKQALVSELQLRHRDIRALDPAVQLPCELRWMRSFNSPAAAAL